MIYTLRSCQRHAVDDGLKFLVEPRKRNGIIVMPTGAGKSLVISALGHALGKPLTVFQPSKEILRQNLEKFRSYGIEPGVFSASVGRKDISEITLATIGSAVKQPQLFKHCKHFMIDEAHLCNPEESMYKRFLTEMGVPFRLKDKGDAVVLGLTASPYRLYSNSEGSELRFITRTRPRVFHNIIHITQIQELVLSGYWCPLEYKIWKCIDRGKLQANSTGSEYSQSSVQRHLFQIGFQDKLVKAVLRLRELGRRNVLVFTQFVSESEDLVSQVPGMAVVSGDTKPAERDRITAAFRSGALWGVANVGVFSLGFDFPELETIVLARVTKSLAVAYQQMGRGVRPHPNKQSCWIVDMVDMVEQFGQIENLRVQQVNGKWAVTSNSQQLTNVCLFPREEVV